MGEYIMRNGRTDRESEEKEFIQKGLLSSGSVAEWQTRQEREKQIKKWGGGDEMGKWQKKSKGVEGRGWVGGKEKEGMWRPREPQKNGLKWKIW